MNDREVQMLQKELAFLYRVVRTVHSLELEEVLKEIVSVADEVTQGDFVLVWARRWMK